MSAGFRNLLVLLVAALMLGASSRAAVCELACGLESAHAARGHAGQANGMGMAHGGCGGEAGASAAGADTRVGHGAGHCEHRGCVPLGVWAPGTSVGTEGNSLAARLPLVLVVPLMLRLRGEAWRVGEFRLPPGMADPPLVGLRL